MAMGRTQVGDIPAVKAYWSPAYKLGHGVLMFV
jgi:hypothetical protein